MKNECFAAYSGNEPYIFISYAHKDDEKVIKVINRLMEAGYRVWYDEGIYVGESWPDKVAGGHDIHFVRNRKG